MSRFCRVSLLLAAVLCPAVSCLAVADRAEAKGGKSFAAKVGTALVVRSIIKNGNKNGQAQAAEPDTAEGTAQVTATAEPVAVTPPPPVVPAGPPNTGLVCIAGCYDTQGRRVVSN